MSGHFCAINICALKQTPKNRSAHKYEIPSVAVLTSSRISFYAFTMHRIFLPVCRSCCIAFDILLNLLCEQRRREMQRSLLLHSSPHVCEWQVFMDFFFTELYTSQEIWQRLVCVAITTDDAADAFLGFQRTTREFVDHQREPRENVRSATKLN